MCGGRKRKEKLRNKGCVKGDRKGEEREWREDRGKGQEKRGRA